MENIELVTLIMAAIYSFVITNLGIIKRKKKLLEMIINLRHTFFNKSELFIKSLQIVTLIVTYIFSLLVSFIIGCVCIYPTMWLIYKMGGL